MKIEIINKAAAKRLGIGFGVLGIILGWCGCTMLRMPGRSFSGVLPAATEQENRLAAQLHADVNTLAVTFAKRNVLDYAKLTQCADWIERSFKDAGEYKLLRVSYKVESWNLDNIEAEKTGTGEPNEIIVIGAHYDSEEHTPGANDNGSGVAALLALAKNASQKHYRKTIRFVAFVNEEPPFFKSKDMGSLVYAKHCKEHGDNIIGMMSLETMGCYFDSPHTQHYPFPFSILYSSRGNFIGFVGDYSSRHFVRETVGAFRRNTEFPSEGAALPGFIVGVDWSDHWSFSQCGYPALMVTDTALFRYAYYHSPQDTPEKLDYVRLARVVEGLEKAIGELALTIDH